MLEESVVWYMHVRMQLNLSNTDTFEMKVNALISEYTVEPQIKANAVISVSLIQGQNTTCTCMYL